ncbi:hypothetical protein [Microbacterium nanhaiense]|nr:hypothetical protein [Microbacterium nanhaiense]
MSDSPRPDDHDPRESGSVPPPPPPPADPAQAAPAVPERPPLPPAAPGGSAGPGVVPPEPVTEVIPPVPGLGSAGAPGGYPAPGSAPAGSPAPAAPAPQPERAAKKAKAQKPPREGGRRRGIRWLIGGGVTVVVLAILGVGGWFAYSWLNDTRFSPEAAAEAYYAKLTSSDVDGALAMWDPADDDDPAIAATAGAFELARAGEAAIDLGDADTYGHRSTIEAEYTVGGLEYRQEISMRYSEREWLIFPRWEVDEIASSYTADALVSEYLQHLTDGRASAAIDMLPQEPEGNQVLVNDEIYQAAQLRPESYEIQGTEVDGTLARVTASYTMGGDRYADIAFTLEAEDEPDDEYGVWSLTEAPLDYVLLWNVAAVETVNGVAVDLSSAGCEVCSADDLISTVNGVGGATAVLPGSYAFAAPESTDAITYGDDQVLTVGHERVSVEPAPYGAEWVESAYGYTDEFVAGLLQGVVSFDARLSEEATAQAVDAVRKQIELCMQSDQFQPKNCPNTLEYRDPGFYAVSDIVRSWAEEPTVEYDPASSSVVVSGGEMKVDYTWRFFEDDPWEADDETVASPFGYEPLRLPVTVADDGSVEVDLSQL